MTRLRLVWYWFFSLCTCHCCRSCDCLVQKTKQMLGIWWALRFVQ